MKIGPKYKICKRLGGAIFEQCQTQKYALSEARTGIKKKNVKGGGMSEYKRQLIEKQKMRFSYGISERQLSRYVRESIAEAADPAKELLLKLESRLDNVVYRLGIAKTRRLARQMVSHGHITVNRRKVTIPSFHVSQNDVIAVREGSKVSVLFGALLEVESPSAAPLWLQFDRKELRGTKTSDPVVAPTELLFNPVEVLQFYSR